MPARSIVEEAVHQRYDADESGKVSDSLILYISLPSLYSSRTVFKSSPHDHYHYYYENNLYYLGQIIILKQFCPWKDHLYNLEAELSLDKSIVYVLFQDTNKSWYVLSIYRVGYILSLLVSNILIYIYHRRIQAVPVADGSFENRLSLPWKGLREEQLR